MGSSPRIVDNCLGFLQLYSDGSVTRVPETDLINTLPPSADNTPPPGVAWKDITYDAENNLSLRLYKPEPLSTDPSNLPVIYYIHGGGFCFGSCTWPNYHACCGRLAAGVRAVVVSPDHRLAPENRLPAALDDITLAVRWLRGQALTERSAREAWLREGVDFDRTFVVGESSGGNLAHHLAVRVGSGAVNVDPVRVRGYVLLAPFFGGSVPTRSEEGPPESNLNSELLYCFWRLSIPSGGTMDHPLVNPFGPDSPSLDSVTLASILVAAGGRELMRDRIEDYAKKLKELGKKVDYFEFEGAQHGFFLNDPSSDAAKQLLGLIKKFIYKNSPGC